MASRSRLHTKQKLIYLFCSVVEKPFFLLLFWDFSLLISLFLFLNNMQKVEVPFTMINFPKQNGNTLGWGGRGKGDKRKPAGLQLHDDIKICVDPQIQRRFGLFPNVIFLSHNFILTICIASPTWFFYKIQKHSVKPNQAISFSVFPRISTGAPFYNFGWKERRLLEGGRLLRNY